MEVKTIQQHLKLVNQRDKQEKVLTGMDLAARRVMNIPQPQPASNRAPVDLSGRAALARRYQRKKT
jgi:hypothetical protein